MMVGHAMLAFALVAGFAHVLGSGRDRSLALGVAAGAFATVPDVDMAYAVLGVAQAQVFDVWTATDAFWRHSQVVHRTVTHSLAIAVPAAVGFALVASGATDGRRLPWSDRTVSLPELAGVAILLVLVAVAFHDAGPLGGAITTVFAVAGVAVALLARNRASLSSGDVLAVSLVGLLTHPFGDVFTGSPPRFFSPLDATLLADRVAIVADPTLNLLAIFGVELATIWLAVGVFLQASDRRLGDHVDERSLVGAVYGVAALVLPAPTLSVSYHFVFSVLAVGLVGVSPRSLPATRFRERSLLPTALRTGEFSVGRSLRRRFDPDATLGAACTGLAAVTVGAIAYTFAYLLVSLS